MQAAVQRALEFDRIRQALASRAMTPLGRTRALALEPAVDGAEVQARLALTSEAVEFSCDGGSLAIRAPEDLPATLARLEVADQPLDPVGLLGLARFLASVETVATSARTAGARLAAIAAGAASFAGEVAAVERAIEPTGDVSDRASRALREIRDKLRQGRSRLRASLESLARGRETAKYVQDQIVTDRNGRYVLVVRAEHRSAIPGIVHGSSTSGASLYLEPLGTVDLNNDVVALVEREAAEVQRVLRALTDAFRARTAELEATLTAAGELDELFAKVDLARRMDAVAPVVSDDGGLEFIEARHPLLIPAIRDLTEEPRDAGGETRKEPARNPVASTLRLVPPLRALVISGPNTGGKTVALKAFGLLALMAQAGLLVPVEPGSRFTPFRTIFADIGDEQSIAASLSTFSAHISNLVEMDRALDLPALVLLDEVGGGTDPAEGGALGAAVVDHFRTRGALVVATTHDDLLKSYAATSEGVAAAGFGFNPETYAPTYQLVYGAPGRSLAFEIAERLGLAHAVIADARARRSGRESLLAAHLAKLDREFSALAAERDRLVADRAGLASDRHRLLEREARLAEREAVLKKRLDDRLNERLREARAEVDQIVGTVKARAAQLVGQAERRAAAQSPVLTTGEVGGLRREAQSALNALGEAVTGGAEADPEMILAEPPLVGQPVFVSALGAEGIVRGVSSSQVDVEVRGKRIRTPVSGLRRVARRVTAATAGSRRTSSHVRVDTAPRETGAARDLVVIGCTVDEAIDRAGKFLDDALLADERRVRVVHGYGTGRLKDALTRFFREHPLVSGVSAASEHEGGGAATMVDLKE